MPDHPGFILRDLLQQGFTVRAEGARLLVAPFSKLSLEQRDLLASRRQALLEWLAGQADHDARVKALGRRATEDDPWAGHDCPNGAYGLRDTVLVAMHEEGEEPNYAAFSPGYLDELTAWCRLKREMAEVEARVKAEKAGKRQKKKKK